MSDDPRLARCVPFPAIRPDALLRFNTSDMIALREKIPEFEWLPELEKRLKHHDIKLIRDALLLALKTGDGFTPLKIQDGGDLPCAAAEAAVPLMHAVYLAVFGGTYAELKEQENAEAPS
jgi:hypothetical protein